MIVVGVVSSMLSSRPHWEGAQEQAVWGCGLLLLAMRRGGVCGSGAGAGHTAAPAGQRAQCRDGWAHVCVAAGSSRGSPRQGTASCNCSSDERRGGCLQRCRAPTEPRSCAQRRQLCRCPSAAPPNPPLQLAAGRSRPACACCCGDERAPLRPARTAAPHSRLRMIRSSSGSGCVCLPPPCAQHTRRGRHDGERAARLESVVVVWRSTRFPRKGQKPQTPCRAISGILTLTSEGATLRIISSPF